uniref:L-rhamnose-binding lectin SML-like n=1 Tax=Gouania willdenowi TaxID=441366 RepID=A0A8C5DYR3_GOUWI
MERAITCDYSLNVHHLSCDQGVISVQSALYGRADSTICSEGRPEEQLSDCHCSLDGTTQYVKGRCDGKKVCELNTNEVRKYNPCRGTFKYLDTNFTCLPALTKVACQESLAVLFCDVGQIIHVYGADYGRRDHTTCTYDLPANNYQNVFCSFPTTKVAESCNGENSCIIQASNSMFGNPCHGTYKYLEVAYVCECR